MKVAGKQDRHKSSDEFDFGLWSMAHLYVFFLMRFDFGTLDSGERSLPFGLLVFISFLKTTGCKSIFDTPYSFHDRSV